MYEDNYHPEVIIGYMIFSMAGFVMGIVAALIIAYLLLGN